MADITKLARIASLARSSVKDSLNFKSLLYDAGVMGDDNDKLVDSLVKQRTLDIECQRALKTSQQWAH
jgi:hypothetical protein